MSRKTSAYARRHQRTPTSKVAEAVLLTSIRRDIDELRTAAELQAFIGANCPDLLSKVGRVVYIVCFAADVHGMQDKPEARILAGTANALSDLAARHETLEKQRASLIAGLAAAERLMPDLSIRALACGAMQLDHLLAKTKGADTSDLRAALMQGAAVA